MCFSCFAFTAIGYTQITDKDNKTIRIPAKPSTKDKDTSPQKIKIEPKPGLEKGQSSEAEKEKETSKKFTGKESKRPFSMIYDDGLISPGQIYEERWKKEMVKGGIVKTMSDQFLGEHRVDTKFVNIVCRDHEYPDGDRVQIVLNGDIIKRSLLLTSSYRRVEVDLIEGRNTIDIIALNQGESGPNTAEFVVYNDKGGVVSSKEWNLLTGVKARIVFINEKTVIKHKSETQQEAEDTDDTANN